MAFGLHQSIKAYYLAALPDALVQEHSETV
jgi:hypothetical protein